MGHAGSSPDDEWTPHDTINERTRNATRSGPHRTRIALVLLTLEKKQARHADLLPARTLDSLLIIAARERILVFDNDALASHCAGMAMFLIDRGIISLNPALNGEARRNVLAHEIAHLWLRHTHAGSRECVSREREALGSLAGVESPMQRRNEDEANLLACAMLGLDFDTFAAPICRYFDDVEASDLAAAA